MSPLAADELVERTGSDLRVRCELECPVANGEEERLEVGILRWGDPKKLRGRIDDRACNTSVAVKTRLQNDGVSYRTHIQ